MLPNKPMGIGPGAGAPLAQPPQGPGPGTPVGPDQEPNPDTMRQQLVMLLKKAKEMAEQNGVNFSDVVSEVEGAKAKSDVPLPRPPAGP